MAVDLDGQSVASKEKILSGFWAEGDDVRQGGEIQSVARR
jgi:hypothetical protein